jgi:hypothetical protein
MWQSNLEMFEFLHLNIDLKCVQGPAAHVETNVGPLTFLNTVDLQELGNQFSSINNLNECSECMLCMEEIVVKESNTWVRCCNDACGIKTHLLCLADCFLEQEKDALQLVPVSGSCPYCQCVSSWGSIIHDLKERQANELVVEYMSYQRVVSTDDN